MTIEKPELKPMEATCPNCNRPAIRIGNEITCEVCDCIFVVTKKVGTVVKTIGIEERIRKLEGVVFKPAEPQSQPGPEPQEPQEPDIEEEEEEEEEILPR